MAPLVELLGIAPHWQTAVLRAQSLAETDARAAAWVDAFILRARALLDVALGQSEPAERTDGRFAIARDGVAIPPALTDILRAALHDEGPVMRAAVFMLVGAAVRSPMMPEGTEAPWDTYEKLRMIADALPEGRRDDWCAALPRPPANAVAAPVTLAGRRMMAEAFAGRCSIDPIHAPPPGAAIDLLLSALIFQICAELADRAASTERKAA